MVKQINCITRLESGIQSGIWAGSWGSKEKQREWSTRVIAILARPRPPQPTRNRFQIKGVGKHVNPPETCKSSM